MLGGTRLDASIIYALMSDYKISREFASVMWYRSETIKSCKETDDIKETYIKFKREISIQQDGYNLPECLGSTDEYCMTLSSIFNQIAHDKQLNKGEVSYLIQACHTAKVLNNENALEGFKNDNYKNVVQFFTTEYHPWLHDYLEEAGYEKH